MNVHTLPISARRNHDIRAALNVADKALNELLRKAVAAWRTADGRQTGSFSQRHHLAISHAYLDTVAIVMDNDGVDTELAHCLAAGIFDVRRLAMIARSWDDGPEPLAA